MRSFPVTVAAALLAVPLWWTTGLSQGGSIGDLHPWARYGLGSWKQVRVFTETLDKNGLVESVSTTDTKTTLVKFDEGSYTLKAEVTVEVAGKRFQAEPKYVTQGLYGETPGQRVTVKPVGEKDVAINGRRYLCQVLQTTIQGDDILKAGTVYRSEQVAPYVLKSETKTSDLQGKPVSESTVDVLAVDMPHKVLTEIKPSSLVASVHRQSDGSSTVTIEVRCVDVPGTTVSHSSKELDAHGRTIRRSTLELIDYEVLNPIQQTSGTLGKKRLLQHFRYRSRR